MVLGTPINGFPRARRLRLLLVALAFGGTAPSQIQHPTLSPPEVSSRAQAPPRSGLGTIFHEGLALQGELIDGYTIHDGDMVLASPDRPVRRPGRRGFPKSLPGGSIPRRDLAAVDNERLWPGGVIPYVIERGFSEQALRDIQTAIDQWNSRTVITLSPRSSEAAYVRFRAEPVGSNSCAADLGYRGAAQSIYLGSPRGCGVRSTIHEIGHTVGLIHEHERTDRDDYVWLSHEIRYEEPWEAIAPHAPAGGPYDYASVMHYRGFNSIPPGIPVGGSTLSRGDIDGVARLYGKPPTATTISTHPPSLEIIVDGQRVTTPARFDWLPGSEHVVEAPAVQSATGIRFLFGRWNDDGPPRRTVTADPAVTWIEANYIIQRSVVACADPPDAGTVVIRPAAPDGFHTVGNLVAVEAHPAPSGPLRFMEWTYLARGAHIRGGMSSNPASIRLWSAPMPGLALLARFHRSPLFRIASNLGPDRPRPSWINMSGQRWAIRLPVAFPPSRFPNGFGVDVPPVDPQDSSRAEARYRFRNWSDGGGRTHAVKVPATGGSLTLNVAPEYRLRAKARGLSGGRGSVRMSPESVDGFHPSGTRVTLTAIPEPRSRFAGWLGDSSLDDDPVAAVVMDGPRSLQAIFTLSQPLRAGEAKQVLLPASARPALYGADAAHFVWVPPDATELTIEFRSSTLAEVDMYVNRDFAPWWQLEGEGRTLGVEVDFESRLPGGHERIVINRHSTPPLSAGAYFIALDAPPSNADVSGTLSASITRSGLGRANPPAFTFSAPDGVDPPAQTVRLSQLGDQAFRYRIESDQPWLTVQPQEWTGTGPGIEQLAIAIRGAALAPGTHRGKFRIAVSDPDRPRESTPAGFEIPVTFVSVGRSEAVPSVSAVKITSTPRADGTYGGGEVIAVEVQFTHPVNVTGRPELALSIGNRTRIAEWNIAGSVRSCGDAYGSLSFRYAVGPTDSDADGIGVPTGGLAVRGGAIRNAEGAEARLDIGRHAISSAAGHAVVGR